MTLTLDHIFWYQAQNWNFHIFDLDDLDLWPMTLTFIIWWSLQWWSGGSACRAQTDRHTQMDAIENITSATNVDFLLTVINVRLICLISAQYKTTGGNGGGAPCILPFIHQTATCSGCIKLSDSDPTYWCSVTDNYDRDQKYGFCPRDAPRVESCTREWYIETCKNCETLALNGNPVLKQFQRAWPLPNSRVHMKVGLVPIQPHQDSIAKKNMMKMQCITLKSVPLKQEFHQKTWNL